MSAPVAASVICLVGLPSAPLTSSRTGKVRGYFVAKLAKNCTARSSGFSSGFGGSLLGLSFFHRSRTSGFALAQSVTTFLVLSSLLTHSLAAVELFDAHSATRSLSANQ